jgi:hypothetical protein
MCNLPESRGDRIVRGSNGGKLQARDGDADWQ